MKLGPDEGGEIVAAQIPRVGHRIVVAFEKMIGEGEEIIARPMVEVDDLGGGMVAVRIG